MNILFLCLKIFFFRIVDVSLGTFVTVLTVKNKAKMATIIGFIDVLIWFLVVKEALNTNVNSIWIAISYAGGYAAGTFIGTYLSNKLIRGKISVQVITDYLTNNKVDEIRENGFAISQINCTGKNNTKRTMLFIEVDKRKLNELKTIIKKIDKNAFIVINETKLVENGFFN